MSDFLCGVLELERELSDGELSELVRELTDLATAHQIAAQFGSGIQQGVVFETRSSP